MSLKLSTRIILSFVIVNVLLLVVAGMAWQALNTAAEGFTDYRALARESNLAAEVESRMLLTRMSVKDYLIREQQSDIDAYEKNFTALSEILAQAREEITSPERSVRIREILDDVASYNEVFYQVVVVENRINNAVENFIQPNGRSMREAADDILEVAFNDGNLEIMREAVDLQRELLRGRLYVNRFLTSHDTADYEFALEQINVELPQALAALQEGAVGGSALREHIAKFTGFHDVYVTNMKLVYDSNDELNGLVTNTLDAVGPRVAEDVQQIRLSVRSEQDALGPQLVASNVQSVQTVLVITLICLIGSIGMALWIVRSTTRSLRFASESISHIRQGDLTYSMRSDRRDEIGDLLNSMEAVRVKLLEIMRSVTRSSDAVERGVEELSRGNSDLSQRTEQQASSLEETAASMEEMTATVRQSAESADRANDLSSDAMNTAAKGGEIVSSAVNAMSGINESSRKVADIIGVIDEIAFQTNLLALNAAVEAARAGEQGRGFAVVAAEVRNLAQRSATAAREIKTLIQENVGKVEDGSRLVNSAGKALQEIVDASRQVSDIVEQITSASREQASGIEQVNQAVMQMDEFTQQNAALVEQTAAASEAMGDQARHLVQQIAFFRLGDEANDNVAAPAALPPAASVAKPKPAPAKKPPQPAAAEREVSKKPALTPAARSAPAPAPKSNTAPVANNAEDEWEEF